MEWWRVGGEESRCGQREREWTLQSNLSSGPNFRRCYWNWSIFVVTRIRWKVFKERKVSAPNKFLSVRFPHWTQDFSFTSSFTDWCRKDSSLMKEFLTQFEAHSAIHFIMENHSSNGNWSFLRETRKRRRPESHKITNYRWVINGCAFGT